RSHLEKPVSKKKPPLLRARTLPAIICPSLNIIQAQLEADSSGRTSIFLHSRVSTVFSSLFVLMPCLRNPPSKCAQLD
ncbi:hypothetical protein AVEN_210990-1, partial [Araneus ventricosus]